MKAWTIMLLALSLPVVALAEESKEGDASKVAYVSLSPALVGNYGLMADRSCTSTKPISLCGLQGPKPRRP